MSTRPRQKPSYWLGAIILALAMIEPLSHLLLRYALPESLAHTGFHIGDTPFFLNAMKIFENGFYSPFATCQSVAGDHSLSYYALPHHWLYGALGFLGSRLGLDAFLFLGAMNGLCFGLWLWAVWRFLKTIHPARAQVAFLLFTLGGGLGGILYLGALGAGATAWPGFESFFHRYARYEFIEGPFLNPTLAMARLYYTLPLALGFHALTRALEKRKSQPQQYWPGLLIVLMLLTTTLLNARLGPLFFFILLCFLYCEKESPLLPRLVYAFCALLPVALAIFLVASLFSMNPSAQENVALLLRRSAWFGSLLSVSSWRLLLALPVAFLVGRGMPLLGRLAAHGALAYLFLFSLLYVAHQYYYGNLFAGGDTAAAIAISDWALLALLPGFALACWRNRSNAPSGETPGALEASTLIFLALFSVSIAAFGGGWFMRFMPERCMVVLGPFLAILAAEGWYRLRDMGRRRWLGHMLLGLSLCGGVLSIVIASSCFQAPLGFHPLTSPFKWAHSEVMLPEDKALIQRIPAGVVLAPASAPPVFGDVIVHQNPQCRTIFGQCSLEFGGIDMLTMAQDVQYFFSPESEAEWRLSFIERWCVSYLYCPATRPVAPAVIDALKSLPWLKMIDHEGEAVLFQVVNKETK